MFAAGLMVSACATGEPGERVERVPAAEVSTRLMAIAEEALAFCPGPQDTDARGGIAAAQRAGWARFIDQEPLPEREQQARGRMQPGDFDKVSTRKVEANDGTNVRGTVRMTIGQRVESWGPDGSMGRDFIGCWLHVTPRSTGFSTGMVTDAEAEAGVRAMTRLAGAPPSVSFVSPVDPPGSESLSRWTFRLTEHGMEPADPEQIAPPGELYRTYSVQRRPIGLLYWVGNSRRWSPEEAERAGFRPPVGQAGDVDIGDR